MLPLAFLVATKFNVRLPTDRFPFGLQPDHLHRSPERKLVSMLQNLAIMPVRKLPGHED